MTGTRSPGDVPILRDQPLMGRCGLCGEWVIYGVQRNCHNPDAGGLILEAWSRPGGRWLILDDGHYRDQGRGGPRWGQRVHQCPPSVLRVAALMLAGGAVTRSYAYENPDVMRRARLAAWGAQERL